MVRFLIMGLADGTPATETLFLWGQGGETGS